MRKKTAATFLLVCILAALTSCAPMPSLGGKLTWVQSQKDMPAIF